MALVSELADRHVGSDCNSGSDKESSHIIGDDFVIVEVYALFMLCVAETQLYGIALHVYNVIAC